MHDELALLGRIKAGDTDAFGQWATSAEASLRASLRMFAQVVDTEAVLQEALLRVWQVAPRFEPDGKPNALMRFAARTVRNQAISELRRSSPPREVLERFEQAVADEATIKAVTPDPLLRAAIAECRRKLPNQPATALSQRLTSGGVDDDAVLATRAGMSLNTFLQNFTRARKLLRACLEKAGIRLDEELA